MKKVSIIIPAYNEEKRIKHTLKAYCTFFQKLRSDSTLDFEIVVVLNGCVDNTLSVVSSFQKKEPSIFILNLQEAGKGLAIRRGFADALVRNNDYIGFVDADMATEPAHFFALLKHGDHYDAIIASRYIAGAKIHPPRPRIKRWGSKIVYESLITLLFGLRYQDYQCGAKVFKYEVLKKVVPLMQMNQWAFDVEILYLCKKNNFRIKEIPTVWFDRAGSKLRISSGFRMLASLFKLRLRNSPFYRFMRS